MQCHWDILSLSLSDPSLPSDHTTAGDAFASFRRLCQQTCEDSSPDRRSSQRRRRAGVCYFPLSAPPSWWTRGCLHMRWFALVWMCKEDVEADPERLTHRLLQYPLATRASWQRWASHTWQTFNHFKHINSSLTTWTSCSRPAINLHPHDIR